MAKQGKQVLTPEGFRLYDALGRRYIYNAGSGCDCCLYQIDGIFTKALDPTSYRSEVDICGATGLKRPYRSAGTQWGVQPWIPEVNFDESTASEAVAKWGPVKMIHYALRSYSDSVCRTCCCQKVWQQGCTEDYVTRTHSNHGEWVEDLFTATYTLRRPVTRWPINNLVDYIMNPATVCKLTITPIQSVIGPYTAGTCPVTYTEHFPGGTFIIPWDASRGYFSRTDTFVDTWSGGGSSGGSCCGGFGDDCRSEARDNEWDGETLAFEMFRP